METGQYENLGDFQIPGDGRSINAYGIPSDSENNPYLLDFGANNIGRIDAKTKEFKFFSTITPGRVRAGADSMRRIVFGSRNTAPTASACSIRSRAKSRNGRCRPLERALSRVPDKNGEVWAGSMRTDRVTRLDPKTSQFTDYLLPRETNIRRVFVTITNPVTFWVGSNHGASVLKLETLD